MIGFKWKISSLSLFLELMISVRSQLSLLILWLGIFSTHKLFMPARPHGVYLQLPFLKVGMWPILKTTGANEKTTEDYINQIPRESELIFHLKQWSYLIDLKHSVPIKMLDDSIIGCSLVGEICRPLSWGLWWSQVPQYAGVIGGVRMEDIHYLHSHFKCASTLIPTYLHPYLVFWDSPIMPAFNGQSTVRY